MATWAERIRSLHPSLQVEYSAPATRPGSQCSGLGWVPVLHWSVVAYYAYFTSKCILIVTYNDNLSHLQLDFIKIWQVETRKYGFLGCR